MTCEYTGVRARCPDAGARSCHASDEHRPGRVREHRESGSVRPPRETGSDKAGRSTSSQGVCRRGTLERQRRARGRRAARRDGVRPPLPPRPRTRRVDSGGCQSAHPSLGDGSWVGQRRRRGRLHGLELRGERSCPGVSARWTGRRGSGFAVW
eukprot:3405139-Pleurochrysis_carterae.AAC.2